MENNETMIELTAGEIDLVSGADFGKGPMEVFNGFFSAARSGAAAYPAGFFAGYANTGTLNGGLMGGAIGFGSGVISHYAKPFFTGSGK
ncbi:hypothetical protein [Burkholderia dolosa]|uniref:hypothetical protein n=1 Tax=Burkholderia dolosa TaxID=152500 RepID=UPI001BA33267|nr:hypothetical protein [Burkholderia dolosa]MBR8059475.1 hypothetical protein [Burkholderia dolosa]